MRSLLLRWSVAIVVGSLWGAILSPGHPGPAEARTTQLVSDAAHYASSASSVHAFASSGDNPMSL